MRNFLFTVFILVLCVLCVCLFLPHNAVTATLTPGTADESVIVIDSGHGGVDGGAVGADGTVEKNINLSISLKAEALLRLFGYKTVMTRTDDRLIFDEGSVTVRQQKTSDIHNRLAIVEDTAGSILLSIHQNKYSVSKYSGAQVFYSGNNPQSKQLASVIQEEIKSRLQPENNRQIKQSGSEIYLLYKTTRPAVMVECGFMSNPDELTLLKSGEYQDKMAAAIVYGLIEFLGQ